MCNPQKILNRQLKWSQQYQAGIGLKMKVGPLFFKTIKRKFRSSESLGQNRRSYQTTQRVRSLLLRYRSREKSPDDFEWLEFSSSKKDSLSQQKTLKFCSVSNMSQKRRRLVVVCATYIVCNSTAVVDIQDISRFSIFYHHNT